jgi:LysM repeat protein
MDDENFVIPEQFKEKGWAKSITKQEDVWKAIDHYASVAGKPVLPHKDANEELITNFTEKMKKYTAELDYSDLVGEDKDLEKALKDAGIPKFQAKGVVDLLNNRKAKEYSDDEFGELLKQKFSGRDSDLEKAKAVLKEAGEDKMNKLLSKKNDDIADVLDVIAEIGKKYDVKIADTMSKISDTPNGNAPSDSKKSKGICKEYYDELNEKYHNNPHATEETKRAIMREYGIIS